MAIKNSNNKVTMKTNDLLFVTADYCNYCFSLKLVEYCAILEFRLLTFQHSI